MNHSQVTRFLLTSVVVFSFLGNVNYFYNTAIGQEELDSDPKQEKILDKALKRKVRILQRKLNSDSLEDRTAAKDELIGLGTEILDYLPDPDPNFGEGFNAAIRSIREEIELTAEKEISSPKRITMKGTHRVSDILNALEVQTGNKVLLGDLQEEVEVTIDWKKKLFWDAADDLGRIVKRQVVGVRAGEGILSVGPAVKNDNVEYSEGFRFQSTRIFTQRDLLLGGAPQGNVSFSLKWEPRYRIIKLQIPFNSIKAVDSDGKEIETITFAEEGALDFGASAEEFSKEIAIPFALSEKNKVKDFELKGTMNAVVSGRLESFVFPNIDQFKEKTTLKKSGVNVTLFKVMEDEHLLAVTVDVGFSDAKATLESHLGWVYDNPAFLVNEKGGKLEFVGTESGGQNEDGIRIIYLFEKPESLKGWSVKYQCPGILIDKEIPFTIPGVKLPF